MKKIPFTLLGLILFLFSCGPSQTSSDFDSTWAPLFGGNDFANVDVTTVTPTNSQVAVGITTIYAISLPNEISGFAFQATVDGNGGAKTTTFRLTIYDGLYQGFSIVSTREHGGFGVLQFNALANQLPGTIALFSNVQQILINANAGRSGITETYDGIMPAIEAMTQYYLT